MFPYIVVRDRLAPYSYRDGVSPSLARNPNHQQMHATTHCVCPRDRPISEMSKEPASERMNNIVDLLKVSVGRWFKFPKDLLSRLITTTVNVLYMVVLRVVSCPLEELQKIA